MKKRSVIINIIEIAMIIAIGVLLLWQGVSDLFSRVGKDMRKEMLVLKTKEAEYADMSQKFFDNYTIVQKHIVNLGAYYLNHTKDPLSESLLVHLQDMLGVQGICILDSRGNMLVSAGEMDTAYLSDYDKQQLINVTEESPISDIVFLFPEEIAESQSTSENTDAEQTDADESSDQGVGFLPEEIRDEEEQSTVSAIITGVDSNLEEESPGDDIVPEEGKSSDDDLENDMPGDDSANANTSEEDDELILRQFISCLLDSGNIVVLHNDQKEYNEAMKAGNSAYQYAQGVTYGVNGTFFFTDPYGNIFQNEFQSPEGSKKIQLPEKDPADSYSSVLNLEGKWYFCTFMDDGLGTGNYMVCALPLWELVFPLMLLCVNRLIIVLFSLILMRLYAGRLSREVLLTNIRKLKAGAIRGRLFILMILCSVVTAGAGVYFHTLYLYSTAVSTNAVKTTNLHKTVEPITKMKEYGTQIYHHSTSVFTRMAAALVSENPEFMEREMLAELANVVSADHILVYNTSGKVIASDRNYTGLSLSSSPDSLSGKFRWVIYGEPVLIQDEVDEHYLNQPYLFSASPLLDNEGNYRGMVQLAIDPSVRKNLAFVSSLETILSAYDGTGNAVALAVENGEDTVHSSYKPYEGLSASELGLTDNELADGYTGFFVLQLKKLIGCCQLSGEYRVIVASFTQRFPLRGAQSGFTAALPGILMEFVFFLVLLFHIRFLNSMPVEERKKVLKEISEETVKAEFHIFRYLKSAVFAVSLLITFVFLAGGMIFRDMTPGYFTFVYPWAQGLHIFTVTRCLCCICIFVFSITCLMKLLSLLGKLLPSKQETFIRLLISIFKYLGGLGVLYFCLTLFGVPASSLFASAGALTIVLTVGAQNIVADILSGLFIIFEGSFKVGDMITVDDWHGQVVEIGIRNTTIRDLLKSDVRIINNSTIKRVINFSEYPSFSTIKIGVEYGTDLYRLEEIFEREKPILKQNLPLMIGDVRYLGVDEFAESAIILKFEATCKNQNDLKMKRALNREIILMFRRNEIHVPFPQVVVHEASDQNPPQSSAVLQDSDSVINR